MNRNQPVGCKANTEVRNVEPLVHVCRRKKNKKNMSPEREDLSAAKPERGRLRGTLGDRFHQARRKGSSGYDRCAGAPERGKWYGTLRALNRKTMVNNVHPKYRNTLRGTYAGGQYDASGRQRGTPILYMGPTGAINGTPMVDNVRSRHISNI